MSLVAVARNQPTLPWWVCPPDRELALRGKINTGYSTVASRIQRNRYAPIIKSTNVGKLSDAEIEIIKRVIKRAEDLERAEEIRIGCLVLKHKQMREASCGDGVTTCILCGCELNSSPDNGQIQTPMEYCHTCAKAACHRCRCETSLRTGERVIMCRLCFEEQDLWCKSGSWINNAPPNVSISDSRLEQLQEEANMAVNNYSRPSLDISGGLWSQHDTEDSASDEDDDSRGLRAFSYNITFNDRESESTGSNAVVMTSWQPTRSRPHSRSHSLSSSSSFPGFSQNVINKSTPVESDHVADKLMTQHSVDEPIVDDVALVSMRSKSSSLRRSRAMTPTQRQSLRRMRDKLKQKQNSLPDDRSRSCSPATHSDLENSLKYKKGKNWGSYDVSASFDLDMSTHTRSSSSQSSGRVGDSESESELATITQLRSDGRASLPLIVVDKPKFAALASQQHNMSATSFAYDDDNDTQTTLQDKAKVEGLEDGELPKTEFRWKRRNASRTGRNLPESRRASSSASSPRLSAEHTVLGSTDTSNNTKRKEKEESVQHSSSSSESGVSGTYSFDVTHTGEEEEEEVQLVGMRKHTVRNEEEQSIVATNTRVVEATGVTQDKVKLSDAVESEGGTHHELPPTGDHAHVSVIIPAQDKNSPVTEQVGDGGEPGVLERSSLRTIRSDDDRIRRMREKARLSARRARQGGMSHSVHRQERYGEDEFEPLSHSTPSHTSTGPDRRIIPTETSVAVDNTQTSAASNTALPAQDIIEDDTVTSPQASSLPPKAASPPPQAASPPPPPQEASPPPPPPPQEASPPPQAASPPPQAVSPPPKAASPPAPPPQAASPLPQAVSLPPKAASPPAPPPQATSPPPQATSPPPQAVSPPPKAASPPPKAALPPPKAASPSPPPPPKATSPPPPPPPQAVSPPPQATSLPQAVEKMERREEEQGISESNTVQDGGHTEGSNLVGDSSTQSQTRDGEEQEQKYAEQEQQQTGSQPTVGHSSPPVHSTMGEGSSETAREQEQHDNDSLSTGQFRRRNATRSGRRAPTQHVPHTASLSHHEEAVSESLPAHTAAVPEDTKQDSDDITNRPASERPTIQGDDAELQRKREKARLAARRMRGGRSYHVPPDNSTIISEDTAEKTSPQTSSAVGEDTDLSSTLPSRRRMVSIQHKAPPPRLQSVTKPETPDDSVLQPDDEEESAVSARFRRRNATRSQRQVSGRRPIPTPRKQAEGDPSQPPSVQSHTTSDDKLI